jgi:phosphoribosyl-ATP pyrophosphohydrolase
MAKSTKKKVVIRPGKLLAARKSKKTRIVRIAAAPTESDAVVLDRLFAVVESRRNADPAISHSARLLSRGLAKVAQKFGEEAVECLIEAVAGNREALIAESADVLYHLLVLWVSAGVNPADVWAELMHREGISGIAEKAARAKPMAAHHRAGTSKIP